MPHQLVNPNWHVILIHYPIGLLSLGLLIEILSFISPRSGFRAAGRWMIGIGALLALPALFSGIYAFRDVVAPEPIMTSQSWVETRTASHWSEEQWFFIRRHIWLNSIATGLAVVVAFVWLASNDARRKSLYWIVFVALLAASGLMAAGSWYGGEQVYRYGTAVRPVAEEKEESESRMRGADYYCPPLQAHVVFAGLATASAIVGIALMLRRWERVTPVTPPTGRAADPLTEDPARDRVDRITASIAPHAVADVAVVTPPRVYPGRFYLAASILALATAFFGFWSVMELKFTGEAFRQNFDLLRDPEHKRLLMHAIIGVLIVITPLVLGVWTSVGRNQRFIPLALTAAAVIAIGLQVWFGIAMLYDGSEGPLFRFNAAAAEHHASHETSEAEAPQPKSPATATRATTRP